MTIQYCSVKLLFLYNKSSYNLVIITEPSLFFYLLKIVNECHVNVRKKKTTGEAIKYHNSMTKNTVSYIDRKASVASDS